MKLQFLEVTWSDSETDSGWDMMDKVKQPTKFPKSYGFFIKETDTYLTIAADYDEETKHFNRFMHIPIVNIQKKRKIKL